jgi:tetratricopeptide (TPR) repeat protein
MKLVLFIALLHLQLFALCQQERSYQVSIEGRNSAIISQKQAKDKLDKGFVKESYPLIFNAISADSSSHRSYELLYRASLTDENYSDSIVNYFIQGKQIFGLDDELCFYIAELYRYRKDYKKSIPEYNNAIKLSQNFNLKSKQYIQYFAGRGYSYVKTNKYDEAISDYSIYLKENPDDSTVLTNRGVCYQKKGSIELAIADWKRAALLENPTAKLYLKSIVHK